MDYSTQNKVNYAKTVTEPKVREYFERQGYIVDKSTVKQDFHGIDLFVCNPNTRKIKCIDVKCPDQKNWNTNNFSFTIQSKRGISYIEKITDLYAFIDIPTDTITFIEFDKMPDLIKSKTVCEGNDSTYYILLPKKEVKKTGKVYNMTTGEKIIITNNE